MKIKLTRDETLKFAIFCRQQAEELRDNMAVLTYSLTEGKTVEGKPIPIDVLTGEHGLQTILRHHAALQGALLFTERLLRGYDPKDETYVILDDELRNFLNAYALTTSLTE